MFRIWGKIWKDNHLVRDMVSCNNDYSMSRTAMVFQALDEICHEFDLSQPIWLDSNIRDFQLHDISENYQYCSHSIGEKWEKYQFSPIEGGCKRILVHYLPAFIKNEQP